MAFLYLILLCLSQISPIILPIIDAFALCLVSTITLSFDLSLVVIVTPT
jgi:hypothetical protein